jgi:protein TonB
MPPEPKAKAGLPNKDLKDGGAPEQPKLKAPVKIAPAKPVTARARPKPDAKRLVTKKGTRRGVEKADRKAKPPKGKPRPLPKPSMRVLEELAAEAGAVPDEQPAPKAIAIDAEPEEDKEKPEKEEPEGEVDGAVDLAKAEPPPVGASGEVAGKDPSADEEGFIPLTEALRRTGGGGATPNIVPNWISSNLSQDGDVGLDEYKRMLLEQIGRAKVYPANWDPYAFTGSAQVAGTVDGFTGRLIAVWLVDSSGRRDIDRAALQTIVRASPFPPIGTAGVLRFQIAIRYGPQETAQR